jgi:hypothetical protein
METCNGIKCNEIETNCSGKVVPSYAQVYVGYDSSYWNILIAFFYLHIVVMLNMYIETREDELRKEKESRKDDNEISTPKYTKTRQTEMEHGTSTDDLDELTGHTRKERRSGGRSTCREKVKEISRQKGRSY